MKISDEGYGIHNWVKSGVGMHLITEDFEFAEQVWIGLDNKSIIFERGFG